MTVSTAAVLRRPPIDRNCLMTQNLPIPIPNEDAIPPGTAGELYRALWAQSKHPSKRRNLEHVWSALQTLKRKKAKRFTVSGVLVALHDANVRLAESSVRNKQGRDYRALIDAYDEQFGTHTDAAIDDSDAFVHGIEDQRVAVRIRQLLAQNKALITRNDFLHAEFRRVTAEFNPSNPGPKSVSAPHGLPMLPSGFEKLHVESVRKFLQDFEGRGWHIDEPTGAVLDRKGMEIAGPGFAFVLRQIIGNRT